MATPEIAPGYLATVARNRAERAENEKQRQFAAASQNTQYLQALGSQVLGAALKLGVDAAGTAIDRSFSAPDRELAEAKAGVLPDRLAPAPSSDDVFAKAKTLLAPYMGTTSEKEAIPEVPAAAEPKRPLITPPKAPVKQMLPVEALAPTMERPGFDTAFDLPGTPPRTSVSARPPADVPPRRAPVAPPSTTPAAPSPEGPGYTGALGDVKSLGRGIMSGAPPEPERDRGLRWLARSTQETATAETAQRDAQARNLRAEAALREAQLKTPAKPKPRDVKAEQDIFIRQAYGLRKVADIPNELTPEQRSLYEIGRQQHNKRVADEASKYEPRSSGSGSIGGTGGISGGSSANYPAASVGVVEDQYGWTYIVRSSGQTIGKGKGAIPVFVGRDLDGTQKMYAPVITKIPGGPKTVSWREIPPKAPADDGFVEAPKGFVGPPAPSRTEPPRDRTGGPRTGGGRPEPKPTFDMRPAPTTPAIVLPEGEVTTPTPAAPVSPKASALGDILADPRTQGQALSDLTVPQLDRLLAETQKAKAGLGGKPSVEMVGRQWDNNALTNLEKAINETVGVKSGGVRKGIQSLPGELDKPEYVRNAPEIARAKAERNQQVKQYEDQIPGGRTSFAGEYTLSKNAPPIRIVASKAAAVKEAYLKGLRGEDKPVAPDNTPLGKQALAVYQWAYDQGAEKAKAANAIPIPAEVRVNPLGEAATKVRGERTNTGTPFEQQIKDTLGPTPATDKLLERLRKLGVDLSMLPPNEIVPAALFADINSKEWAASKKRRVYANELKKLGLMS